LETYNDFLRRRSSSYLVVAAVLLLLFLVSLTSAPDRCRAWGSQGDQITAYIAAEHLSPVARESGKSKARRELVTQYRNNEGMRRYKQNIKEGHERVRELTAQLTSRPEPKNESAYEGAARAPALARGPRQDTAKWPRL
jgi:hypothetical protein